jgi:hypothetical protein
MTLAEHLFVSSTDGALFDTRMADWNQHPLRADYCRTHTRITNTHELRATLRAGPWAWPGGYPMYFIASDGAALSFEAVRENYAQCARSLREHSNDGWRIEACDINWEDPDLMCEHTGKPIQSAY